AQGPAVYTFTVRVADDGSPNLSDEETITLTVNEVNKAPVLNLLLDQWIDLGQTVRFTTTASDADLPVNALTCGLGADAPSGATIDPVTGIFSWAPDAAGLYDVTLTVTDDGSPVLSARQTFHVRVFPVNVAPVLAPIGVRVVGEETELTFTAFATDA